MDEPVSEYSEVDEPRALEEGERVEPPSSRSEAEMLLRRADDAYLDARYKEALLHYRAVAEGGFGTADVWFNLGNACWRDGRLGEAVLAWERALLRDPRHRDARANLSLARSSLIDDVVGAAPAPAVERLARRMPLAPVVWGLAGAWMLTVLAWLLRRRKGSRRRLLALAAACGLLAVMALGALSAIGIWYHEVVERAVVTKPVAQVRAGPAPRFDAAFEVHEGLVVRIIAYEGPYARVRLDNERDGWILRRAIQGI